MTNSTTRYSNICYIISLDKLRLKEMSLIVANSSAADRIRASFAFTKWIRTFPIIPLGIDPKILVVIFINCFASLIWLLLLLKLIFTCLNQHIKWILKQIICWVLLRHGHTLTVLLHAQCFVLRNRGPLMWIPFITGLRASLLLSLCQCFLLACKLVD